MYGIVPRAQTSFVIFKHGQDLDPKFYTQKYLKIAKCAHFTLNIDNIEYFVHLTDFLHGRFPWRP